MARQILKMIMGRRIGLVIVTIAIELRNKTDELWGGRGAGERNKSDERELQVPTT